MKLIPNLAPSALSDAKAFEGKAIDYAPDTSDGKHREMRRFRVLQVEKVGVGKKRGLPYFVARVFDLDHEEEVSRTLHFDGVASAV